MFDEIVYRANLACRISPGQLAVGHLCFQRQISSPALVVISQTLDKLLVHNCGNCSDASWSGELESGQVGLNSSLLQPTRMGATDGQEQQLSDNIIAPSACDFYIGVKDVVTTVAIKRVKVIASLERGFLASERATSVPPAKQQLEFFTRDNSGEEGGRREWSNKESLSKDLLLVGCFTRLIIYDTFSRSNLFTLNTPTPINAISSSSSGGGSSSSSSSQQAPTIEDSLCVCGGPQRLYLFKLDWSNLENNVSAEITSERSIEDTVRCIARGHLEGMTLILVGSLEQRISVYQLDTFDQNIQSCKLSITESAQVNCLQPINTLEDNRDNRAPEQVFETTSADDHHDVSLPPVALLNNQQLEFDQASQVEQMNYFAFGLENGLIGVHRLIAGCQSQGAPVRLTSERVWRFRCKHVPITLLLCDANGDGFDELVIGFRSGRIEVRSPFTGQLLSVTRAFKQVDHRLVGLTIVGERRVDDEVADCKLIACSTNGALVAFKPPALIKGGKRKPLRCFKATSKASGQSNWTQLAQSSISATTTTTQQVVSGLKPIEEDEEERSDVLLTASSGLQTRLLLPDGSQSETDLHIESKSDETKPSKCDSKQNLDLLQRVNSLYGEQLDLQRRACCIYRSYVQQVGHRAQVDGEHQVNVSHRWDFNLNAVRFELTIVIRTSNAEEVRLVELEDNSGNFLTNGYLLINGVETSAPISANNKNNHHHNHRRYESHCLPPKMVVSQSREGGKSYTLVVPMLSQSDSQSRISVKAYCSRIRRFDEQVVEEARVCSMLVEIPEFSMFVLASMLSMPNQRQSTQPADRLGDDDEHDPHLVPKANICLAFRVKQSSKVRQIVRWLYESFLCFQTLASLSKSESGSRDEGSPPDVPGSWKTAANPLPPPDTLMMDELEGVDAKNSSGKLKFQLRLVDIRNLAGAAGKSDTEFADSLKCKSNSSSSSSKQEQRQRQQQQLDQRENREEEIDYTLRIAYSTGGWLTLDSDNSDLVVHLVQSLVIDRLQLKLTADKLQEGEVVANLQAIQDELILVSDNLRQLEESEKRIQSELYESADHTKNLMQQLEIANELNEFALARELLNELFIMLCGVQNAAKAHCLNNRRAELARQVNALKKKISFLSGNGGDIS